jgi:hypothetical protein
MSGAGVIDDFQRDAGFEGNMGLAEDFDAGGKQEENTPSLGVGDIMD